MSKDTDHDAFANWKTRMGVKTSVSATPRSRQGSERSPVTSRGTIRTGTQPPPSTDKDFSAALQKIQEEKNVALQRRLIAEDLEANTDVHATTQGTEQGPPSGNIAPSRSMRDKEMITGYERRMGKKAGEVDTAQTKASGSARYGVGKASGEDREEMRGEDASQRWSKTASLEKWFAEL